MNKTALRMEDSHAGPVCILSIGGRIDSGNAADLLDRLNGLLAAGEKTILLDFKEVLYLTSAAFRVLLGTAVVFAIEGPAQPQAASVAADADLALRQPQLVDNG